MRDKVVLGLSGGVDSALSASLLKERGFSVVGVFLDIGFGNERALNCARALSIELKSIPVKEALHKRVVTPFVSAYMRGETPIPCVLCNRVLKFALLFDVMEEVGAAAVSTGHYAKVVEKDGDFGLYKANSVKNDQSYMLNRLKRAWLPHLIFPLGEFSSKEEVRQAAEKRALPAFNAPDSMEICFIPDDDYQSFIERQGCAVKTGRLLDRQGRVLGEHTGIHRFTVGQRKGIHLNTVEKLYVQAIDPLSGDVTVSPYPPLSRVITVKELNILDEGPFAGPPFEAYVKIRHTRAEHRARVQAFGDRATVTFEAPVRAAAKGQSAVFYHECGRVLGGGVIEEAQLC